MKKWRGSKVGLDLSRHDSLLKKVIEGRFLGKKIPGRTTAMLMDIMMQEDEDNGIIIQS